MRGSIVIIIAAILLAASSAFAAAPILVDIEGVKQGKFKSETAKGFPAYKLLYEVKSPRDAATGQASGKRQHGSVCFTKDVSANSPQIFQATTTNEVLKTVNFRFIKTNPNGEEYAYFTLKLTNGTLASYKLISGYADGTGAGGAKHTAFATDNLEDVCISFQKIEMQGPDGKTMAMDDWTR